LSPFPIRVLAVAVRWAVRIVGALLLLSVLAWSALHWFIVPRIDASSAPAGAGHAGAGHARCPGRLTVEANGLVPQVAVHDLRVPGAGGQGGLQVPRALVVFSVPRCCAAASSSW
jgi:hypothetical protein